MLAGDTAKEAQAIIMASQVIEWIIACFHTSRFIPSPNHTTSCRKLLSHVLQLGGNLSHILPLKSHFVHLVRRVSMKLRDLSDWYKKGVTQEHENQQQIQLRLGTIFKEKEVDIPQAFGSSCQWWGMLFRSVRIYKEPLTLIKILFPCQRDVS